jgi:hypothetical protein
MEGALYFYYIYFIFVQIHLYSDDFLLAIWDKFQGFISLLTFLECCVQFTVGWWMAHGCACGLQQDKQRVKQQQVYSIMIHDVIWVKFHTP